MTPPTPSVTLPSIHLNGTSRVTLLDGYLHAYQLLCQASDALNSVEFNARDYYVQGPDAWSRATTERDAMRHHIRRLKEYLEAHLIHLSD